MLNVHCQSTTPLHAGGATLVKGFLYVLCKALAKRSATALALAEDHRNDIMSNSVAIVTAAVATEFRHAEADLDLDLDLTHVQLCS